MAESIFTVLEKRITVTAVKGEGDFEMTLPRTMPSDTQFEEPGVLLEWAEKHGITHAVLQKGIQKHLIDLRAKFRAIKKDETWNYGKAQSNVNDTEWDVMERPNVKIDLESAKNAAAIAAGTTMAGAMRSAGLDDNVIMSALIPTYGQTVADAILDGLN